MSIPDVVPNMLKKIFVETEKTFVQKHCFYNYAFNFMHVTLVRDLPGNLLAGTNFTSACVNFDKGIIEFYEEVGEDGCEKAHKFLLSLILVTG